MWSVPWREAVDRSRTATAMESHQQRMSRVARSAGCRFGLERWQQLLSWTVLCCGLGGPPGCAAPCQALWHSRRSDAFPAEAAWSGLCGNQNRAGCLWTLTGTPRHHHPLPTTGETEARGGERAHPGFHGS